MAGKSRAASVDRGGIAHSESKSRLENASGGAAATMIVNPGQHPDLEDDTQPVQPTEAPHEKQVTPVGAQPAPVDLPQVPAEDPPLAPEPTSVTQASTTENRLDLDNDAQSRRPTPSPTYHDKLEQVVAMLEGSNLAPVDREGSPSTPGGRRAADEDEIPDIPDPEVD